MTELNSGFETGFETQRYPTVEETVVNNVSTLYRRKKYFLADLRRLVGTLGYAIIVMVYLRDFSLILLCLRLLIQFLLSEPFPNMSPELGLPANLKENQANFLMRSVFLFNGVCVLYHILFPLSQGDVTLDHYYHGSSTMQFIGELGPISIWGTLAYDAAILCLQLVFHALMCGTDDLEVLSVAVPNRDEYGSVSLEAVSDGFNGNVTVISIDVLANIKKYLAPIAVPETGRRLQTRESALQLILV